MKSHESETNGRLILVNRGVSGRGESSWRRIEAAMDHPALGCSGKVEFSLMDSRPGTIFIPAPIGRRAFLRLGFSKPGRQEVQFYIARDAGNSNVKDFCSDGEGGDYFNFTADQKYQQEMKSLDRKNRCR